jgi:hypothetical protein
MIRSLSLGRLGWIGAGLLSLCLNSQTFADLDSEAKQPYRLQVVVHIAEHRPLATPVFKDQVERALRNHLQAAYGKLAKVEVVRTHPRLKEVLAKGLQQALDGWDELSNQKTHFVLISFAKGRYEIQARQHDGFSGLASPVVRHIHTTDHHLVGLMAARLVDRDFGLAGTVTAVDSLKGTVTVALKGGAVEGVKLSRWIRAGDVFAISRITKAGVKQRGTRLEWALLKVTGGPDAAGVCTCQYFHRYQEDKLENGPGTLGYRCLKLTTVQGPLRLRLLDETGNSAVDKGTQVHVYHNAYQGEPRKLNTEADGWVPTGDESYANVAFVRVLSGKTVRAQIPVVLVDDRTVVCRVTVSPEAEAQGQLDLRRDRWVRRIYDSLRLATDRVRKLNELVGPSRAEALKRAQEGAKGLQADLSSLRQEQEALTEVAAKLPGGKLDLSEGEQRLKELGEREVELAKFIGGLEKVLKEENDPAVQKLKGMLEQARLLETEAEYGHAIELYTKVLKESKDKQPKVEEKLKQIEEAWKPKNDAHAQARKFIYEEWPTLDPSGVRARLADARKAFEACRKVNDTLYPQKLLRVNIIHAAKIGERIEVLRKVDSEDNRTELKGLITAGQELKTLHEEVNSYLAKAK